MVIEYFLDWVETAPVNKRVEAAAALVKAYLRRDIAPDQRDDAEAAITTLLEDPAPTVRLAVAEAFGAFPTAPRHIILSLGNDALDISIVALSQSPVFHDAELVEFAVSGHEKQQIAVACRPWLSSRVTAAIAEHGVRNACLAVLFNEAAVFSLESLHLLSKRFGDDTEIRNLLAEREDLAAETRVLLIEKLGSQLATFVGGQGWTSEAKAEQTVAEACDRASIMFAATASDDDVRRIVRARITDERLTVAYLVRAVCMGNISLVAHAFSELSGVHFDRVETVLTQDRKSAFRAIYDRAGLPNSAFKVFDIAISAWRDLLKSSSQLNQARLPFLVTKEVLAQCHSGKSEVVDDLLVLLRRLSAEAARESARSKAVEITARGKEPEVALLEAHDEAQEAVADAELIDVDNSVEDTGITSGDGFIDEADLVAANEEASTVSKTGIAGDAGFIGGLTDEDFEELYAGVEFPDMQLDDLDFSKAA